MTLNKHKMFPIRVFEKDKIFFSFVRRPTASDPLLHQTECVRREQAIASRLSFKKFNSSSEIAYV